jgi:hypothetical protein
MIPLQVQIESWLKTFTGVAALMHTEWAWPFVESVHFIGLTLLLGSIAAWDLRLVGLLKHVPAVAFHKLVPLSVLGFAINVSSGTLFLMAEPDQYIYNPAFHLKMLCLALAGLNIMLFYVISFRKVASVTAGQRLPLAARLSGAISLALWIAVIVCGRMITFFRPFVCSPGEAAGLLAACIVR